MQGLQGNMHVYAPLSTLVWVHKQVGLEYEGIYREESLMLRYNPICKVLLYRTVHVFWRQYFAASAYVV